jgi:putative Mn2+ efflux pump MntP
MFFLSSILIGISLSLDCFAISISQGLRKNLNPIKAILILSFLFAFFQSGMLLIGYFAGSYSTGLLGSLATWTSAILLFLIGAKMIKEGLEEEEENEVGANTFRDYFVLSVSTSTDALAAGFTLPTLNLDWVPYFYLRWTGMLFCLVSLEDFSENYSAKSSVNAQRYWGD